METRAASESLRNKAHPADMYGSHEMHVVARSKDGQCIMTNYHAPTFTSMYISHMPEYESLKHNTEDAQLLYNAILFLHGQTATHSLREYCVASLASSLFALGLYSNIAVVRTLPLEVQRRLCQAVLRTGQQGEKKLVEVFGKAVLAEAKALPAPAESTATASAGLGQSTEE